MWKRLWPVLLIIGIFFLDQISKVWTRANLTFEVSQPVLEPFFYLTYIENTGAAFGILAGNRLLLTIFTLAFLMFFAIYVAKRTHRPFVLKIGFSLIVAGALGNLWDRIAKGSVTDMFDFRVWPIFNVADVAVSVGFVLLIIYMVRYDNA